MSDAADDQIEKQIGRTLTEEVNVSTDDGVIW